VNELPEEIERSLARLDRRAAAAAARVDAERVAARVIERLRTEPADARWASRVFALPRVARVAAAAVVILVGALAGRELLQRDVPRPLPLPAVLQAADSGAEAAILEAVADLPVLNVTDDGSSTPALEDLSEEELMVLLQAIQSSGGAI
jgi:hypothetical protein